MIFLLFGSPLWFFLFLFALFCVDIFAFESDNGWVASVAFLFFFCFIFIWGDVSPFVTWLTSSYKTFLGSIAGYIAMGVGWGGFIEWHFYLKRQTLKVKEDRRFWLIEKGVKGVTLKTTVPSEMKEEWTRHLKHRSHDWKFVSKNRGKIISTMTWWPMAMVRTLLREPFLFLYNLCAEWFQAMADKAAKNADVLD